MRLSRRRRRIAFFTATATPDAASGGTLRRYVMGTGWVCPRCRSVALEAGVCGCAEARATSAGPVGG